MKSATILTVGVLLSFVTVATSRVLKSSTTAPGRGPSRLAVHIPHALFREGGYDHQMALFGLPPYGGSITQYVYYAEQDMCDWDVDTSKGYPTRPDNGPWQYPFILMVDRGGCSFVQKVRNAQKSGAAAVVIADNMCMCNNFEGCDPQDSCETQGPIMADDGSGSDISIPSFFLFKADADEIKRELKSNRPVQMEMAWNLPNPDDRVEYDLWTTPGDKISKEFIENFGVVAKALGERVYFNPHMYINDGVKLNCHGEGGINLCEGLCTNKGRYCATDPDFKSGVWGADVVRESLRRLCIWEYYGSNSGQSHEWWEYVKHFSEFCNKERNPNQFKDPACINSAMKKAKVDKKKIESCMLDSGGTEGDTINSYLSAELDMQRQSGVLIIPTAVVNSAIVKTALTVHNVFQAICTSFTSGTEPDICFKCLGCLDTTSCVKQGRCPTQRGGSGVWSGFSVLLVMGLCGSVAIWYYKRTQGERSSQERGILAEYMPVEPDESM